MGINLPEFVGSTCDITRGLIVSSVTIPISITEEWEGDTGECGVTLTCVLIWGTRAILLINLIQAVGDAVTKPCIGYTEIATTTA